MISLIVYLDDQQSDEIYQSQSSRQGTLSSRDSAMEEGNANFGSAHNEIETQSRACSEEGSGSIHESSGSGNSER